MLTLYQNLVFVIDTIAVLNIFITVITNLKLLCSIRLEDRYTHRMT